MTRKLTIGVIICVAVFGALFVYEHLHSADGKPVSGALGAQAEWLTDFGAAQQRARAENKPILINFTGSDWCPPCELLEKDVFSQREFADYAAHHLILLKVDFPHGKPLPAEQQEANDALAQRFYIQGFPTILVLGPNGKLKGQVEVGVVMTPPKFIAHLESITKKP